jgi:hypothetical protein
MSKPIAAFRNFVSAQNSTKNGIIIFFTSAPIIQVSCVKKAQQYQGGGRILWGDNTGGGAVTLRPIRVQCAGVRVSAGLIRYTYSWTHTNAHTQPRFGAKSDLRQTLRKVPIVELWKFLYFYEKEKRAKLWHFQTNQRSFGCCWGENRTENYFDILLQLKVCHITVLCNGLL